MLDLFRSQKVIIALVGAAAQFAVKMGWLDAHTADELTALADKLILAHAFVDGAANFNSVKPQS